MLIVYNDTHNDKLIEDLYFRNNIFNTHILYKMIFLSLQDRS